jgi:hypothetical protein
LRFESPDLDRFLNEGDFFVTDRFKPPFRSKPNPKIRRNPISIVLPAEIERYKPRVLKTSLSNEDEAKLKAALSKAA